MKIELLLYPLKGGSNGQHLVAPAADYAELPQNIEKGHFNLQLILTLNRKGKKTPKQKQRGGVLLFSNIYMRLEDSTETLALGGRCPSQINISAHSILVFCGRMEFVYALNFTVSFHFFFTRLKAFESVWNLFTYGYCLKLATVWVDMRDWQLNTYTNQQGQDLIAANLYWLNIPPYKDIL